MAGARINHHERTKIGIDHSGFWRDDSHQTVIDRPVKLPPIEYEFRIKLRSLLCASARLPLALVLGWT